MCICMLSIIVNNYSKIEREKNVFAFIPGLKSEVFPLTHIREDQGNIILWSFIRCKFVSQNLQHSFFVISMAGLVIHNAYLIIAPA